MLGCVRRPQVNALDPVSHLRILIPLRVYTTMCSAEIQCMTWHGYKAKQEQNVCQWQAMVVYCIGTSES